LIYREEESCILKQELKIVLIIIKTIEMRFIFHWNIFLLR